MRTVVYCRVSNLKDESQSFIKQEYACIKYCRDNNLRVRFIHKEHNSGWGKQKILENLILTSKKLNIIINDISRFSRNIIYGTKLLDLCRRRNIILHFVKENIRYDPSEEANTTILMKGLQNSNDEWNLIRNRTIANIKVRRNAGLLLGRAPFGFDADENKKLVKNNDFNVIRLIISLRNGVKKINEIREILKKLSNDWEQLNFYEDDLNDPSKNFLIANFSSPLTLDFKTIANLLNEFKICGKHWIPSRVTQLYKKYSITDEFKEETDLAKKFKPSQSKISYNNSYMEVEY
jgi:DNA invertase Pin-like site-specific DNA recombinase